MQSAQIGSSVFIGWPLGAIASTVMSRRKSRTGSLMNQENQPNIALLSKKQANPLRAKSA
jgi:hypothetical protein